MKKIINTVLIFSLFAACSNAQSKNDVKKNKVVPAGNTCCIPDSNLFSLKRVDKTLGRDDIFTIKQLKNLTKEQVKAWIAPIPAKDRHNIETTYKYYKAASFQKRTGNYSSVLLMMIEEIANDYVIEQQVLITVDNKGKYINGLPVSYLKNLSNSDVEMDSTKGTYQFSMNTRSQFIGDTIKVQQLVDVGKTPQPHSSEDTWQEVYETIYVINPQGKIVLVRDRRKIADEREKKK